MTSCLKMLLLFFSRNVAEPIMSHLRITDSDEARITDDNFYRVTDN
jgi:hypothetical protein